jgi:hypothetical protein
MERYVIRTKEVDARYISGCPLLLSAYAVLIDNFDKSTIGQIKFQNIGNKQIVAISIDIACFDLSGAEVEGISNYWYTDLTAKKNDYFGNQIPLHLPNPVTYQISVIVRQIFFFDKSVWNNIKNEPFSCQFIKQFDLTPMGILVDQYCRELNILDKSKHIYYIYSIQQDYWLCTCGTANLPDDKICRICNRKLEDLQCITNSQYLQSKKQEYEIGQAKKEAVLRAEKEAAEKKEAVLRAEKEAAEKKVVALQKKRSRFFLSISLLLVVFILFFVFFIIPMQKYKAASTLLLQRKYDEAATIFTQLDNYKDSAILVQESYYKKGTALLEANEFDKAIEAFEKSGATKIH